jgi:hypothetical protein
MSGAVKLNREPNLVPPRGAAIAGVIFAILTIIGFGLVRYAIPTNVNEPGTWVIEPHHRNAVRFALRLVPFAGIAFLWFIGVLWDRLGTHEDRFFARMDVDCQRSDADGRVPFSRAVASATQ